MGRLERIPQASHFHKCRMQLRLTCSDHSGKFLFLPEWSEHVNRSCIRHLWKCEACGMRSRRPICCPVHRWTSECPLWAKGELYWPGYKRKALSYAIGLRAIRMTKSGLAGGNTLLRFVSSFCALPEASLLHGLYS